VSGWRVVLWGVVAAMVAGCELVPPRVDERSRVLVVENAASPVSQAVARYYLERRGIPRENLVQVRVPDSAANSAQETLAYDRFRQDVEGPLRAALRGREDAIRYIVLTKGVPIRVRDVPRPLPDLPDYRQTQSLDSTLAALDTRAPTVALPGARGEVRAAFSPNYYWASTTAFEHRQWGGYLVTRLDGYTEADARALVDRSLLTGLPGGRVLIDPTGANEGSARPQPVALVDTANCTAGVGCPGNPRYGSVQTADFNADLLTAAARLGAIDGLKVVVAPPNRFVSSPGLIAYASWGSNDRAFNGLEYAGLAFIEGAIAETAVSTSARTFLPTTGGQSLIADLVRQGVTGVKGYTDEPFLDAVASPTLLFGNYFCGENLATSFYRASRLIGWRDVVLGDPLARLDVGATAACPRQ